MKLLSKTATERYQSAAGLAADLQKCLEQLEHAGAIHYVAIGQEDLSRPFEIPQKLYGRSARTAHIADGVSEDSARPG